MEKLPPARLDDNRRFIRSAIRGSFIGVIRSTNLGKIYNYMELDIIIHTN